VLNIFFGSEWQWSFGSSVGQAVKRQKGAKMNALVFFFLSFSSIFSFILFLSRETFLQIETQLTYYTTFISRTHLQNQQILFNFRFRYFRIFFLVKLMCVVLKSSYSFFIFFCLFFGLFWTLMVWQWLEGHRRAISEEYFVGFSCISIYSVFSAGLAWGIMAKTLPEISSNWAFTLSKTGSIWALFKI